MYINSRHQSIKLTFGEAHNDKIAFLDILINRIRIELEKSLFRKKTFTVAYLNFNSQ